MRKSFRFFALTAAALAVTALTAQAQGAKQFGAVLGVDFAKATGDDASGAKSKTGFMGGLFVAFPVGSSVMIEPEILYSMKGTKFEEAGDKATETLDYIEIPVLFRYNFSADGGAYILAGPAVNFNITCKESFTPSGGPESKASCSDIGLKAKTTFGGVLGLGYGKGHIGIEGRYDMDFNEALEFDDGTSIKAKNSAFAILIRLTK